MTKVKRLAFRPIRRYRLATQSSDFRNRMALSVISTTANAQSASTSFQIASSPAALEQHSAQDSQEVGERDGAADPLGSRRHRFTREHESREQHRRQDHQERQLHRLYL